MRKNIDRQTATRRHLTVCVCECGYYVTYACHWLLELV